MSKKYSHIEKHKKKYVRFALFFFITYVLRALENYILFKTTGLKLEIDFVNYMVFIIIATIFTLIAEITEKILEEEELMIEKRIKKKIERDIKLLENAI